MTSEPGVDAGLVEVLLGVVRRHSLDTDSRNRAICWNGGLYGCARIGSASEHDAHVATHLARAVQAYTEQRADERVVEALEGAARAVEAITPEGDERWVESGLAMRTTAAHAVRTTR